MKDKGMLKKIGIALTVLALLGLWHLNDVRMGAAASGDAWLVGGYVFLWMVSLAGVFLIGRMIYGTRNGKQWSLEKIYPAVGIGLGFLYLLVLPPMSAPDEISHYISAYELSSRMLGQTARSGDGHVLVRAEDWFLEDVYGSYEIGFDGRYWEKTGDGVLDGGTADSVILGQELKESTYRVIHDVWLGRSGTAQQRWLASGAPNRTEDAGGISALTEQAESGRPGTDEAGTDEAGSAAGAETAAGEPGSVSESETAAGKPGSVSESETAADESGSAAGRMVVSPFPPVNTTFIAYLPQAVGIAAARLLHLDSLWLAYLGRICNLLFFVGLTWLAMKRMPFGKEVLFGVALLPMTLHLSASFSYDVMILACMFLLTAVCLDLAYAREKVRARDVVLLAVLMAAAGPCKMIYAPMMGLCLLIPVKKFGGWKRWLASAAAVSAAFFIAMAAVNGAIVAGYATAAAETAVTSDGEAAFSLSLLLHRPGLLLSMFYNTLLHQLDEYHLSMIGAWLGNLDPVLNVPYLLTVGFTAALFLLAFRVPGENIRISGGRRVWFFAVCAACAAAALLSMLIACTPRDSLVIEGVQGRYFLPFLPILLMACKNDRLVLTKDGNRSILYLMFCANVYVLLRLYSVVSMRM